MADDNLLSIRHINDPLYDPIGTGGDTKRRIHPDATGHCKFGTKYNHVIDRDGRNSCAGEIGHFRFEAALVYLHYCRRFAIEHNNQVVAILQHPGPGDADDCPWKPCSRLWRLRRVNLYSQRILPFWIGVLRSEETRL